MSTFIKMSDKLSEHNVSLKANRTDVESDYSILQLQCCGNLQYSKEFGIKCIDKEYPKKISNFINLAKNENSALVITPECSIPMDIIIKIINNKDKWPQLGNLWCLCAEGCPVVNFQHIIKKLNNKPTVELILNDENITYSNYVNALWYLFVINKDLICVTIQLKQKNMKDTSLLHEGKDLSKGNTTYIFDLNGNQPTPTKNILLSLICADALSLSTAQLLSSIPNTYPLLINPQLNAEPFSSRFVVFRKKYFTESCIDKTRMITANWAINTNIIERSVLKEAGSSYYADIASNGKYHVDLICKDLALFNHRLINHRKGMINFLEKEYSIWNLGNEEQCISYHIMKQEYFGGDRSLDIQYDPHVHDKYLFKNEQWKSQDKPNCLCLWGKYFFKKYAEDMDKQQYLPINTNDCINKMCVEKCDWLYNDFLFGVCFGSFLKGELESNCEESHRTILSLNSKSENNCTKKRRLFEKLIELLGKNQFPNSLMYLNDNHKFEIDQNCAETGSNNIYNLAIIKAPPDKMELVYKKAIVSIIDTDDISDAEFLYNYLKDSTRLDYKDQIIVYYRSDDDHFIAYDKPHTESNIGISNPGFTLKTSSIIGGKL